MRRRSLRRAGLFTLAVGAGLHILVGVAVADPPSDSPSAAKEECSDSHHSDTGHGANDGGGYQSTCDETDFGEPGQGPDDPGGRPCAGCVGNADDKDPPGQHPDGGDANSGYECDGRDRPFDPTTESDGNGNHGVGDENPAHTGCSGTTTTQEETCPDGSAMPTTDRNGDGAIDERDCSTTGGKDTCPDGSPLPTTDRDGNGTVDRADCRVDDDDDDDDTRTSRTEVLSGELQASPTSGPGQVPGELAFTDDGAVAPGAAPALGTLPRTGAGDLNARLLALGAAFLLLGGVLVRAGRATGAATP